MFEPSQQLLEPLPVLRVQSIHKWTQDDDVRHTIEIAEPLIEIAQVLQQIHS